MMKLDKNQKTSETPVNVNDVSRIAKGASLKGDLSSSSDIRVDGRVDGTLFSKGKVVAGETACLLGNILCNNVDLCGKVDGDIYVKDVLSVKSTAIINGNIHVRKVQVEMGAQINGSCRMISDQEYDKLVAAVVKNGIPDASDESDVVSD